MVFIEGEKGFFKNPFSKGISDPKTGLKLAKGLFGPTLLLLNITRFSVNGQLQRRAELLHSQFVFSNATLLKKFTTIFPFPFQSLYPELNSLSLRVSTIHKKSKNKLKITLKHLHITKCSWTFQNIDVLISDCTFIQKTNNEKSEIKFMHVNNGMIQDSLFEGAGRTSAVQLIITGSRLTLENSRFSDNWVSSGLSLIEIRDESRVNINRVDFLDNFVGNGTIKVQSRSHVLVNDSVFLSNKALENGGCFLIEDYSSAAIIGSNFTNNQAHQHGGVLFQHRNSATLIGEHNVFMYNIADREGGVVTSYGYAELTVTKSVFIQNEAIVGGCFVVDRNNSVQIYDSVFQDNYAVASSGAIQCFDDCTLRVINSTFRNNSANDGGAVASRIRSNLYFSECTFYNNTSHISDTGAIVIANKCTLTILHSQFVRNTASRYAGAILAFIDSVVDIKHSNFTQNRGKYAAGCIYAEANVTINIEDSLFYLNEGSRNAGVMLGGETAYTNIYRSHFINNTANTRFGGAITGFGKIFAADSLFQGNSAGYKGGAIGGINTNEVYLLHTVFYQNYAFQDGGSVYCFSCNVKLYGSNFTENRAKSDGGSIYMMQDCALNISHSYFDSNVAEYGDGGAINIQEDSSVYIADTIFIRNRAANAAGGVNILESVNTCHQLSNVQFIENRAGFMAGALQVGWGIRMLFRGCEFKRNQAKAYGGAVKLQEGGEAVFEKCIFLKNEAQVQGGGIYAKLSNLKLSRSEFTENKAHIGQAIYIFASSNEPPPENRVLDSTFSCAHSKTNMSTKDPGFTIDIVERNLIVSYPQPIVDIMETPFASSEFYKFEFVKTSWTNAQC